LTNRNYRHIYGPVPSWRLGSSLGVDPISGSEKACTFDCVYCQIGKTRLLTDRREKFVSAAEIEKEISSLPPIEIDYITFSGAGEPTLAKNLGQIISSVKKLRKEKTAVLTNSSLMYREDVAKDLSLADLVVCKLDAPSQDVFEKINRPVKNIRFDNVIRAIKDFKGYYKGRLALQIMFIQENRIYAKDIARVAKEIRPDEVQLNTPLRPCGVRPLSRVEMAGLEGYFASLNTVSVYNAKRKAVSPISAEDTLKRRGKI